MASFLCWAFAAVASFFALHTHGASYNGLAITPQMGWVCTVLRKILSLLSSYWLG